MIITFQRHGPSVPAKDIFWAVELAREQNKICISKGWRKGSGRRFSQVGVLRTGKPRAGARKKPQNLTKPRTGLRLRQWVSPVIPCTRLFPPAVKAPSPSRPPPQSISSSLPAPLAGPPSLSPGKHCLRRASLPREAFLQPCASAPPVTRGQLPLPARPLPETRPTAPFCPSFPQDSESPLRRPPSGL